MGQSGGISAGMKPRLIFNISSLKNALPPRSAIILCEYPPKRRGTEFAAAVRYYDTQRPGLGDEFAAAVQRTIDHILQYPEVCWLLSRRTRCCPTNRFPWGD